MLQKERGFFMIPWGDLAGKTLPKITRQIEIEKFELVIALAITTQFGSNSRQKEKINLFITFSSISSLPNEVHRYGNGYTFLERQLSNNIVHPLVIMIMPFLVSMTTMQIQAFGILALSSFT
jgi:hypothetical protein